MALTARKPEVEDFPIIEAGVKLAVCFGLFDLGIQYDKKWEKSVKKALIMWELPEERITINDEDKPRAISKKYTLSLHKKAQLRKDLEAWRGKTFTDKELEGFDVKNILGKACQIQIIHSEDGKYANIAALMALPRSMTPPKAENPLKYFSFEDSTDIPEDTPKWVADIIKTSQEYKEQHGLPTEEDNETELEPF